MHHIGPRGEVRVAAVREYLIADLDEGRRFLAQVISGAADEELRMRGGPRVVGRNMVGHEVQDQANPAVRKGLPCRRQPVGAAEHRVHLVSADAVRRTDDVVDGEVGQDVPAMLDQGFVRSGDRDTGRAALPHPHQPHHISTGRRDRVPHLAGDITQFDAPAAPPAELVEPRPRVDLVDERVRDHPVNLSRTKPSVAVNAQEITARSPGATRVGAGDSKQPRMVTVRGCCERYVPGT